MEFGIVPHTELDKIDFGLPNDGEINSQVLPGEPTENSKVFVGLPRWGRKDWVGKLYPLRTKEGDYLHYYSAHFNMVELNATHYQVDPYRLSVWSNMVKTPDFLFCPKMIKDITHAGPLYAKDLVLEKFVDDIKAFGKHLGPIFIQLSESYSFKKKGDLFQFIEMLPTDMQIFVEVRHEEWFVKQNFAVLTQKLREHNVGLVITDTAGRRDCLHMSLTIPKTFIRFVTNNLHPSDFDRTDKWAERLKTWLENGIQEIYFVIHMRDEEFSLDLAQYVVQKMNEVCELNLKPLEFVDQNRLFK